jgi:hypothetical protein
LAAADACKAGIGKLIDKMGLEYNVEGNADDDAVQTAGSDKEEVTILDDDDIEEIMINGDVELM